VRRFWVVNSKKCGATDRFRGGQNWHGI
jgi:hypothetical protein